MVSIVTEDTGEMTRVVHPKDYLENNFFRNLVHSENQFNLKIFLPNDLSYYFPPFIMLFKIFVLSKALSYVFVRNC